MATMMLCIDVVGEKAGIAWNVADQTGWVPLDGKRPSAALLPALAACMKNGELETVGVVTGPGSFTGIRTGIATALGLKAARGLRVLGLNKFQLMGFHHAREKDREKLFLIPARNDRIYACAWTQSDGLGSPQEIRVRDVSPRQNACTTAPIETMNFELLEKPFAQLCLEAVSAGLGEPELKPLYIRPADTRTNPTYIEKLLSQKN